MPNEYRAGQRVRIEWRREPCAPGLLTGAGMYAQTGGAVIGAWPADADWGIT